jgi:PAS domain-containing protein
VQEIFVRASEFPRQFGHLSQAGGIVFITHHGRETHALLPIADYHEFATAKTDGGLAMLDQNLADWLPLLFVLVDDKRAIVMANRTAHAMARKPGGSLPGCDLLQVMPTLRQTIFESYLSRTERAGEPCSFDLPDMFNSGTWHRVETFRSGANVAILARDITDEMKVHRLADTNKALIDAMLVHGGIGYMWINVRGRIEQVDTAMGELLQLPIERLVNVPVLDLVPVGQRAALRELIENALAKAATQRVETEFLCNDGTTVPAVCGIKDLRGLYGCEGAMMVVTRQ